MLVGTKADVPENERDVSTDEGDSLAEKYGLEFYEVSSVRPEYRGGIDEAMYALARLMCIKFESL